MEDMLDTSRGLCEVFLVIEMFFLKLTRKKFLRNITRRIVNFFVLKPLYQRVLIVFGGPLANFILAFVIFFSIYTFIGKDFTPAMINEVQKDSPAMVGGLKQNDVILEIDGNKVKSIMDVSKYIMMSTSDIIDFKVERSYEELILKIKPNSIMSEDNLGNKIKKRL